jgi:DNA-binding CsgD family transcriptional regulator
MGNRWPFVGRVNELDRITSLIASGTGALVLGESGVGKTALARRAEELCADAARPVGRVFGHAVSNGAPFEAFAGVLTAPATSLFGPVEVARHVAAALGARPGSARRALFVVDDAHLLDDRSAQVLLQLAAEGTATILATARSAPLPSGIDRLWRDGLCERVELRGLTDGEIVELVESVLGAPVEPAAARAFAERSEGNPLLLRELVGAALDASTLVWRSAAWALAGPPPLSTGIRDLVRSRLAGLPETRRVALEAIAAGEPLAVAVAVDLVGEAMLDQLDSDRLISVRTGLAGPEVGSAHPLHGEVLRADMPALRLRRVRLELAGRLEAAPKPSPHDLVRAALWRLESGQCDEPERLLTAARAARSLSLETAERLARQACEASGSLQATLLLAEILTHTGRSTQAAALTDALPPDSLTPADREALVYCAAVGQGLLVGDAGGGADIVGGVLAGVPGASDLLRGVQASLLAFDARFAEALEVGAPIAADPAAPPAARTFAAVGTVGAEYWLGRTRQAVAAADEIAPIARTARDALPFGAAGIELLAICALLDEGDFGHAEQRAHRMRRQAAEDDDVFSGPRAEYCLGRVALMRGRPVGALRSFQRCLAALTPFDQSFVRHISSMLARAAAAAGQLPLCHSVLDACAHAPRMKTYEPEFELARAAVLAAELRLAEAADHAAWSAGAAADFAEWNVAVAGYHDAARYCAARHILIPMRAAAAHADGTFAPCLLEHATALAARDPIALGAASRDFEAHGALLFAAEASAEAALAHTDAGQPRPARASAARAAQLWGRCEGGVSPWLVGAAAPAALTARERQVAALAALGHSDAAIAGRLAISARTVQTHLAHVYDKLGITSRAEIGAHLGG